ncbi:hypothetical protein PM082_008895 [Marasmius tenuissimus]|nr:hypothetical protein PM082_008895 [Marasmius tenuissimus]
MLRATNTPNTSPTSNLMLLSTSEWSYVNLPPKLVQKPLVYSDVIGLVKKHYRLSADRRIVLQTNQLDICQGKMTEITEEAWEDVRSELGKVHWSF